MEIAVSKLTKFIELIKDSINFVWRSEHKYKTVVFGFLVLAFNIIVYILITLFVKIIKFDLQINPQIIDIFIPIFIQLIFVFTSGPLVFGTYSKVFRSVYNDDSEILNFNPFQNITSLYQNGIKLAFVYLLYTLPITILNLLYIFVISNNNNISPVFFLILCFQFIYSLIQNVCIKFIYVFLLKIESDGKLKDTLNPKLVWQNLITNKKRYLLILIKLALQVIIEFVVVFFSVLMCFGILLFPAYIAYSLFSAPYIYAKISKDAN